MKKTKLIIGSLGIFTVAMLLIFAAKAQQAPQLRVYSTNLTGAPLGVPFVISSNRMNIRQIQIANSTLSPVTFELFNVVSLAPGWNGTNNVTPSYVSRASYTTNIATSFIDSGGFTNWFTNSGTFSYNVTNAAATNAAAQSWVVSVGAGQAVLFNTDLLHEQTTIGRASTNCSVTLYYNLGQ